MMGGKIIDGIDIETGEIVDPTAVSTHHFEEVENDDEYLKKVAITAKLWPDFWPHWDSKNSGYIIVQILVQHSQVKTPISVRFEYTNNTIFLKSSAVTQIRSFNVDNQFIDVDEYIHSNKDILNLDPDKQKRFKSTLTFRKHTPFAFAAGIMSSLQHKIYRAVMLTKKDVLLYTRLDRKVLLGESLVEKIIFKGSDYMVTEKDGEKKFYVYQTMLENRSTNEIVDLINKI